LVKQQHVITDVKPIKIDGTRKQKQKAEHVLGFTKSHHFSATVKGINSGVFCLSE
jgi:hypothetical protein